MIRLLRNPKNKKVVGVAVGNKHYSVSRELAQALSLEEEASLRKEKHLKNGIQKTKEYLEKEVIKSDAQNIGLEVLFDELNRVESEKTIVHFKSEVSEKEKSFIMEYLEDFVLALNRAQYKRAMSFTNTLKNFQSEKPDKSA